MNISSANKIYMQSHQGKVKLLSAEREMALRELASSRADVDEDKLFLWDAEISNDLLDSYFTHMSESTLRNYAADAERGVAFLRGHDWKSLPLGYSLSGSYDEGEGRKRVIAGFYTVRGLQDTDDLIYRMEMKILRDVSVGFFGGRTICDICGLDFWDCRHYPGLTYEEKKDGVISQTLSTFTIDNARLSEVSGVFDGSTPEAMIRKAEHLALHGELNKEQTRLIESRLKHALPLSATFSIVASNATQGEKIMNEEEVTKIRSMLSLGPEGDVLSGVEDMSKALTEANKRIASLEPQAKEGVQYRKDLIDAALAEGVRAQGAEFDSASYQELLENAPLATIKRMRDDWSKVAHQILPPGRQSTDGAGEKNSESLSLYPDSAFI